MARGQTKAANPDNAEMIRMGVLNACAKMPSESATRRENVDIYFDRLTRAAEEAKAAKDEVNVGEVEKRLTRVWGVHKDVLAFMKKIEGKKPGDRAAILTQLALLSMDKGYLDKDLVSLAEDAGKSAGSDAGDQGSVFDKTATGERMGGTDAEPRLTVEVAGPAAGPSTPGIPLDEALRQLEQYNAANPVKRGAKPKERKRLEEQVETAEKARLEAEAAAPPPPPPPDDFDQASGDASPPPAPKAAAPALVDDDDALPPPSPKKSGGLKGATGSGSYTLN